MIDYRFNYGDYFSDGVAAVKVQDKWGFIDKKGKIVIEPMWDGATFFKDGFAMVMRRSKSETLGFGVINRQGKPVIEPTYRQVFVLWKGVIVASKDENDPGAYIDAATGKVIYRFEK